MRQSKIYLCIVLIACYCSTQKRPPWLKENENRSVHFRIPVFQYEKFTREENLFLTEEFAKVWSRETKTEYFIFDEKIATRVLKSGKLIPSSNYLISAEIYRLKDIIYFNSNIKNLETGEIIASAQIKGKSVDEIKAQFANLILQFY